MKCLLLGIDFEALRERERPYNNGMISAETAAEAVFRYVLKEENASPDQLIVFLAPDAICEKCDKINLFSLLPGIHTQKESRADFLHFKNEIEKICDDEGVGCPKIEEVKFSDDEKDQWAVFNKVQNFLKESGASKETISITVANASGYAPITNALSMTSKLIEIEGYGVKVLDVDLQKGIIRTDPSLQLQLYEAVCMFKDTGSTERIKMLSGRLCNEHLNSLCDQLIAFSDDLNICQVEALEPVLDRIYFILDKLEHDFDTADNFTWLICDKLREIFGDHKPFLSTILHIKCAFGWRWTSASLTLFVDALPKELVKKKIVECDLSSLPNSTQTPEIELFYTHLIKDMPMPENDKLRDLFSSYFHGQLEDSSECLLIEHFTSVFRKFENAMNEKDLTVPYEGIDILSSFSENKEAARQLAVFIDEKHFATMNQLKRELANHIDIDLNEIFSDPLLHNKKNTNSQKLMGLKYWSLKHLRRKIKGLKLNIDYHSIASFRRFLAFYFYIKIMRNIVLHAQSKELIERELNVTHMERLRCFGVDTSTLTFESLSRNVFNALYYLEECLITEPKRIIKKYYIALPDPDKENDRDFQFKSIFDNVSHYETIKVYVVKNWKDSSDVEKVFISKLKEYVIDNDIFYDIKTITHSDEPSDLLRKLTDTVQPGDEIIADTTYLSNFMMCVMFKFFKSVIEKKAVVKNVLCDDHILTDMIYSLFDATDGKESLACS